MSHDLPDYRTNQLERRGRLLVMTLNRQTHRAYNRVREEPPQDRITRAAWFVREHDEVHAATWALPAVKSAANCAACHTRADQGEFRERDIRIPR